MMKITLFPRVLAVAIAAATIVTLIIWLDPHIGAKSGTGPTSSAGDEQLQSRERDYMAGQRDSLKGKLKVYLNEENCWVWSESPWDSGRTPTYVDCVRNL